MTDNEFDAAFSRSGLSLKPETLVELRAASAVIESWIATISRDLPLDIEPATVFHAVQVPCSRS